ncbi:MAG: hypothetical protein AB2551_05155 [Candidatus Thiodiazotropha sp.]
MKKGKIDNKLAYSDPGFEADAISIMLANSAKQKHTPKRAR